MFRKKLLLLILFGAALSGCAVYGGPGPYGDYDRPGYYGDGYYYGRYGHQRGYGYCR
jgi:hypothetical protein